MSSVENKQEKPSSSSPKEQKPPEDVKEKEEEDEKELEEQAKKAYDAVTEKADMGFLYKRKSYDNGIASQKERLVKFVKDSINEYLK